jgi:hypothetical protein
LKEYITYKIYNLISDMSFRVRLLDLNIEDSSGKKKPINVHAFFLEDLKDLAKRNECTEWKKGKLNTELTNRKQMTVVAIFQYMIGNTDWSVPVTHNTRLILSKKDTLTRPFVIPYDFDYSGLVNTFYAIPDEQLHTETVRERVYRGFPRNEAELNEVIDIFKKQKENIYSTINNFNLLTQGTKKEMTEYLDEFYKIINDQGEVKSVFIYNARTE